MDRIYDAVKEAIQRHDPEHRWTPEASLILTQLVSYQLDLLAIDLESFTKHARRSTVTVDDVKLCIRHNQALRNEMQNYIDAQQQMEKPVKRKREGPVFPTANDWPEDLDTLEIE